MSDTHYRLNKRIVWMIGLFVLAFIVSILGYGVDSHVKINKTDKDELVLKDVRLGEAIEINQKAIQLSTLERLADRQEIALNKEKLSGHKDNPVAHTN